jgi:Holliday junction resolvasome RuvABC endonuclease subunit
MIIIGVDLGNKSRNSIAVMNENLELLECSNVKYNSKTTTTWEHRKRIIKQLKEYIKKYNLTKDDYLLFEQIFFSRGLSRMANITSMAFIQATIINEFSDIISISEVHVQSWKCKVLGGRSATKDDAVAYVEKNYPQVDLNVVIEHKRKGTEILKDNDTADAICIATYGHLVDKKKLDEHLVNYT